MKHRYDSIIVKEESKGEGIENLSLSLSLILNVVSLNFFFLVWRWSWLLLLVCISVQNTGHGASWCCKVWKDYMQILKKYHANAYIMFFDSYTNVTLPWHSYGFIMSPRLYYQHESLHLCSFELLTFRAHVLFYRSSLATDLDKTSYGSFISISEENSVLSLRVLVCKFYNNDKVIISLSMSTA